CGVTDLTMRRPPCPSRALIDRRRQENRQRSYSRWQRGVGLQALVQQRGDIRRWVGLQRLQEILIECGVCCVDGDRHLRLAGLHDYPEIAAGGPPSWVSTVVAGMPRQ